MNKNIKTALVGGGALIAAYFLLSPSTDESGLGGGGGLPLLPSMPSEGESGVGDIIYNFSNPFVEEPGFVGFDPAPETVDIKKATTAPITQMRIPFPDLVRKATPSEKTFLGMATSAVPHPMVLPNPKKGKDARILNLSDKPKRPVQFGDASVGGFFDFLYPVTQLGKGAVGRSSLYDVRGATEKPDIASKRAGVLNIIESSGKPTKYHPSGRSSSRTVYTGGFNAAGGFSRVRISADNPRGVPGWKQVGAKKPTGPGQPDRY